MIRITFGWKHDYCHSWAKSHRKTLHIKACRFKDRDKPFSTLLRNKNKENFSRLFQDSTWVTRFNEGLVPGIRSATLCNAIGPPRVKSGRGCQRAPTRLHMAWSTISGSGLRCSHDAHRLIYKSHCYSKQNWAATWLWEFDSLSREEKLRGKNNLTSVVSCSYILSKCVRNLSRLQAWCGCQLSSQ